MKPGQSVTIQLPDGTRLVAKITQVSKQTLKPVLDEATGPKLSDGKQIKEARELAGLTQKQLAEQLRMSVATVNKIENPKSGGRGPNPASIFAIKQKLGLV